jgi:hypothetical protein
VRGIYIQAGLNASLDDQNLPVGGIKSLKTYKKKSIHKKMAAIKMVISTVPKNSLIILLVNRSNSISSGFRGWLGTIISLGGTVHKWEQKCQKTGMQESGKNQIQKYSLTLLEMWKWQLHWGWSQINKWVKLQGGAVDESGAWAIKESRGTAQAWRYWVQGYNENRNTKEYKFES